MDRSNAPGYRFKEGKLYIFTERAVTVIEGWPRPRAVQKRPDAGWHEFCPRYRLVRPYRRRRPRPTPADTDQLALPFDLPPPRTRRGGRREEKRRAFDAFRFSLPREVARPLERFQRDQFALLQRLPDRSFADLLGSNPVLAFTLAHAGPGAPPASARQRQIVHWLGLPDSPSSVKLLRKVPPESLGSCKPEQLEDVLKNPETRTLLAHLPQIGAGVLALVGDRRMREVMTPSLLLEVAAESSEKYRPRTAELLADILHMHDDALGAMRRQRFHSLAALRRHHDETRQTYLEVQGQKILEHRFPRPPVPGHATIVPLRQPQDLVEEGIEQHNCVASYASRVADGSVYIYRVLAPERATLALRRQPGEGWQLAELLRAGNREVSEATEEAVEAWLDEYLI